MVTSVKEVRRSVTKRYGGPSLGGTEFSKEYGGPPLNGRSFKELWMTDI